MVQAKPVRHKLPDEQSITVHADEAQRLGEALLRPSLLDPGFEGPDVAESAVISALAHQEPALRKVPGSAVSSVLSVPVTHGASLGDFHLSPALAMQSSASVQVFCVPMDAFR